MWQFQVTEMYKDDFYPDGIAYGIELKFKNKNNRFVRFAKFTSPFKGKDTNTAIAGSLNTLISDKEVKEFIDNIPSWHITSMVYYPMFKTNVSEYAIEKAAEIGINPVRYMDHNLLETVSTLIRIKKSK